jgi:hypothetical protein
MACQRCSRGVVALSILFITAPGGSGHMMSAGTQPILRTWLEAASYCVKIELLRFVNAVSNPNTLFS